VGEKLGVVFITGGNRGIGAATAHLLAESGYEVVIGSRTGEASANPKISSVRIDVSNAESIEKAITEIEEQFGHYRTQNESKNVFKAFKTPATLVVVVLFFYFVSGFFGLLGLYPLANIANLLMGLTLITLSAWAYIR
jgi:NAD(P)-dependent dehydrogenase (short-subunit alcohol dehydrogenase family)